MNLTYDMRFDEVRLEVSMTHIIQLKDVLSTHLPWHGARLNFLAMFLVALFKVKTVNFTEIATALNPNAKTGSNHRRLQRFFADFELDYDLIAKLVVALGNTKKINTLNKMGGERCEQNIFPGRENVGNVLQV